MLVYDHLFDTNNHTIGLYFNLKTMLDYPIQVLRDTESVLMKRISRMKDGKPKTSAQDRLNRLRDAIKVLSRTSKDYMDDNMFRR